MHIDVPKARDMIKKLSKLNEYSDVLPIIAHDYALDGCLPIIPKSLNGWSRTDCKAKIDRREKELEGLELRSLCGCQPDSLGTDIACQISG